MTNILYINITSYYLYVVVIETQNNKILYKESEPNIITIWNNSYFFGKNALRIIKENYKSSYYIWPIESKFFQIDKNLFTVIKRVIEEKIKKISYSYNISKIIIASLNYILSKKLLILLKESLQLIGKDIRVLDSSEAFIRRFTNRFNFLQKKSKEIILVEFGAKFFRASTFSYKNKSLTLKRRVIDYELSEEELDIKITGILELLFSLRKKKNISFLYPHNKPLLDSLKEKLSEISPLDNLFRNFSCNVYRFFRRTKLLQGIEKILFLEENSKIIKPYVQQLFLKDRIEILWNTVSDNTTILYNSNFCLLEENEKAIYTRKRYKSLNKKFYVIPSELYNINTRYKMILTENPVPKKIFIDNNTFRISVIFFSKNLEPIIYKIADSNIFISEIYIPLYTISANQSNFFLLFTAGNSQIISDNEILFSISFQNLVKNRPPEQEILLSIEIKRDKIKFCVRDVGSGKMAKWIIMKI